MAPARILTFGSRNRPGSRSDGYLLVTPTRLGPAGVPVRVSPWHPAHPLAPKIPLPRAIEGCNRAGRYLYRPGSAWSFDIGFKGRFTVRLFLLILERDLGGAGRVAGVIQAAFDAEEDCADQDNSHCENGNRPAPGSALQTSIQKRQQKEQRARMPGTTTMANTTVLPCQHSSHSNIDR